MRRSAGEGHRSKEGKLFRWELRLDSRRIVRKAWSKGELDQRIDKVLIELRTKGLLELGVKDLSFGEAFQRYLEAEIRPEGSPRTYESYESIFRNHLAIFVKAKLNAVQTRALQTLCNSLKDEGKLRSADYVISIVSRFYSWCIRNDLTNSNPATGVKRPRQEAPKTRAMTSQEAATIMTEARRRFELDTFRCYPVLLFCLNTGVRISEALALRRQDLKCEDGLVLADITGQIHHKHGVWEIRPAKCGSSRTILLNEAATEATDLSAMNVAKEIAAAKEAYQEWGFLFPNEVGGPMLRCVPYTAMCRLQRSIGIADSFTVHELRHTYLTHVARRCPIQVTSKIAGHSSTRTTERYIKALDGDVVRAMNHKNGLGIGRRARKARIVKRLAEIR